jgi:maltose-binding protein MalE
MHEYRRPRANRDLAARRPASTKLGYIEETWGWKEQMTAQFTVYAKSNQRANELVSWFHRMMMQYAFGYKFFQGRGVCYFAFEERLADRKSQDFGQELYIRELRYAVHLNLQDVFEAKTLEDVTISTTAKVGGELASFDVNNDGQ